MSDRDHSHPHAQETGVFVRKQTRCRDCGGTGHYYQPGRPPTQCMTCGGYGNVITLVWRPHSQHYRDWRKGQQP
jgi:DnaJ-class molecular chaperone